MIQECSNMRVQISLFEQYIEAVIEKNKKILEEIKKIKEENETLKKEITKLKESKRNE